MTISQQLELFPELASPHISTSYTLDTNGTVPMNYTFTNSNPSISDQMNWAVDITDNIDIKIYKLFPEAHMPELGTEWAACFDLKASMREGDSHHSYK